MTSRLELSEDGKAMKFYEVNAFAVVLTPQDIVTAVQTLSSQSSQSSQSSRSSQKDERDEKGAT